MAAVRNKIYIIRTREGETLQTHSHMRETQPGHYKYKYETPNADTSYEHGVRTIYFEPFPFEGPADGPAAGASNAPRATVVDSTKSSSTRRA